MFIFTNNLPDLYEKELCDVHKEFQYSIPLQVLNIKMEWIEWYNGNFGWDIETEEILHCFALNFLSYSQNDENVEDIGRIYLSMLNN